MEIFNHYRLRKQMYEAYSKKLAEYLKFNANIKNENIMETKLTKRQLYHAMFKKWLEITNLKAGDTVKILSSFISRNDESEIYYNPLMDRFIGKTYKVNSMHADGVLISDDAGAVWLWDFRSLEKVELESVLHTQGSRYRIGDNIYTLVTAPHERYSVAMLVPDNSKGLTWSGVKRVSNTTVLTNEEFLSLCKIGTFVKIK